MHHGSFSENVACTLSGKQFQTLKGTGRIICSVMTLLEWEVIDLSGITMYAYAKFTILQIPGLRNEHHVVGRNEDIEIMKGI